MMNFKYLLFLVGYIMKDLVNIVLIVDIIF